MKKFLFAFLAVFFLPLHVHSQAAVTAPILEGLLGGLLDYTTVDQAAYYIQAAKDAGSQIKHLAKQGQFMADTLSRSILNIGRLGDVKSWGDFMDWYNRQLYMERQAQETFERLNVSIGNKTYSLLEIESWGRDLDDARIDFWNNEFNEEQRKQMWLSLGLTPSNYAYVQTWKEKEIGLARKLLANPVTQNNKYIQQMTRSNEFLKRLAGNADLPEEDQLGDPEIAAIGVEVEIDSNKTLHDIDMAVADLAELEAIKYYQAHTPYDQPVLSDWPDDVFSPLN